MGAPGDHRSIALARPASAVRAGGVADPGLAPRLAGVPQVITVWPAEHGGPVDVVLPRRFRTRREHDLGLLSYLRHLRAVGGISSSSAVSAGADPISRPCAYTRKPRPLP